MISNFETSIKHFFKTFLATNLKKMRLQYSTKFFEKPYYEKIICSKLSSLDYKSPDAMRAAVIEISKNKDVYTRIYLLTKIEPECEYVNDEILKIYGTVLKDFNIAKFRFCDAQSCIKNLISNKLTKELTVNAFIGNLYNLVFEEDEIEYARKLFGFANIHKYFRVYIDHFYVNPAVSNKVMLFLRLLNNAELAMNLLDEIFKKLKNYVDGQSIDEHFFDCIEVLNAVLLYNQDLFSEKSKYLHDTISFIVKEFTNPENTKFTTGIDIQKLGQTVHTLLQSCSKGKNFKHWAMKLYKRKYKIFMRYLQIKTTVFEEVIALTILLEILSQFHTLTSILGSKLNDQVKIKEMLDNYHIKRPHGINVDDYAKLFDSFIIGKYKMLNIIANDIDDFSLDTNAFTMEMSSMHNHQLFFASIENLWPYIDWDAIIHVACKTENLNGFVDAITNNESMKCKKHLAYVYMYVQALSKVDNQPLILLVITRVIENYTDRNMDEEQLKFFILMYMMDIKNKKYNNCISKRRQKILNFLYYKVSEDLTEYMLNEIKTEIMLQRIRNFDGNVLLIILLTARKSKNIQESTLNAMSKYIIQLLAPEYEKSKEVTNDITQHISALVAIINFHGKEISFDRSDYSNGPETFIKIILALLSSIFEPADEKYIVRLKKVVLNFLFTANLEQKRMIGSMLKKIDSKIIMDNENDYNMINGCQKMIDHIKVIE